MTKPPVLIPQAINELKLFPERETLSILAIGHSMEPRVKHRSIVVVKRVVSLSELKKGDIVLAKVKGRAYLHLVKAISAEQVLIANNKGRENGWTKQVYAKLIEAEPEAPTAVGVKP